MSKTPSTYSLPSISVLTGWILGGAICASFFAFGLPQMLLILRERGPTALSCREYFSSGNQPRWVRLTDCRLDIEQAPKDGDVGDVFPALLPDRFGAVTPPDGAENALPLYVRTKGRSSPFPASEVALEGMIDADVTVDIPPQLESRHARILYPDKPSYIEIALAIVPGVLYAFLARRRLRKYQRHRKARAVLTALARAAPAAGDQNAALADSVSDENGDVIARVFDVTELLSVRRRIRFTVALSLVFLFPIVVGTLVELLRDDRWPLAVAGVVTGIALGVVIHRFWCRQPIPSRAYLALPLSVLPYLWVKLFQPSSQLGLLLALLGVGQVLFLGIPLLSAIVALKRTTTFETALRVDRDLQDGRARRRIKSSSAHRDKVASMRFFASVLLGGALLGLAVNLLIPGCGLLLAVLFGSAALGLWRRAKKHGTPRANEVRELDRRQPILLLRSFVDDDLSVEGDLLDLDLPRLIAEHLNVIGPVIALPAVNERLQPVGPYRVDLQGKSWTEAISSLISEACAIIMICGRSEGLAWELSHVTQPSIARKTTFFFPSVDPEELTRRWMFLTSDNRFPALAALKSIDPNRLVSARSLDARTLDVVTADQRDKKSYAAALAKLALELRA